MTPQHFGRVRHLAATVGLTVVVAFGVSVVGCRYGATPAGSPGNRTPLVPPGNVTPVVPPGNQTPAPLPNPPVPAPNPPGSETGPGGQVSKPPSEVEKKLDAALIQIARSFAENGPTAARSMAASQKATLKSDRVQVEIVCLSPEAVAAIGSLVTKAGGSVQTTFENRSYVWLPIEAITKVAAETQVWSMAVVRATLRPPKDSASEKHLS